MNKLCTVKIFLVSVSGSKKNIYLVKTHYIFCGWGWGTQKENSAKLCSCVMTNFGLKI